MNKRTVKPPFKLPVRWEVNGVKQFLLAADQELILLCHEASANEMKYIADCINNPH